MKAGAILDVNYCALALAILNSKFTVERALGYICGDIDISKRATRKDITSLDIEDMIKMRSQNKTYREIAEIYGIEETAIFNRIKRYKKVVIKS